MLLSCPSTRAIRALTLAGLALAASACGDSTLAPPPATPAMAPRLNPVAAAPTELFISEIIEGSSNNKAIEIYNGTGAAVNLATAGYNVQMYFNGNAASTLTINLTGTVAAGDVYVIAQSSSNTTILAQADQTNGSGWFNGDDAVVLRKGTANIDIVGQIGFDPGSEWGSGLISTADNTLRRKSTVCAGDTDGSNVFDPSVEWDGFAIDNTTDLGSHTATCGGTTVAPTVTSTTPAANATDIAPAANVSVTFSQPVVVTASWFAIDCSTSGAHTANVSGGATTFTLDPDTDFVGSESCTVTITGANVADQASPTTTMAADYAWSFTTVSANACSAPFTAAWAIQGSGLISPIAGQSVTTQGVVVGDYEGASPELRGFYLQDATGDGNTATSDAVFVFNGNANSVNLGDVVRITGTVSEFQEQTQVTLSGSPIVCGTASVPTTDVTLPVASGTALERYEGMLVRLPQTLYVTEHFQLGRFGQVVLSSSSRLSQPTNVALPGAAASAVQTQNDLNRIIVDDATNGQNPDPIVFGRGGNPLSASNTLRGGDHATGIVGVLTYTWAGNSASGNAYRVRPSNALGASLPAFVAANARPTAPASVGGTLKVAALNLLNYFNTFGSNACTGGVGGASTDCRGADNSNEFLRQVDKTVAAITGMNADVVGIVEIENDGYGVSSAIADLVARLNTATGVGTYAFIDADAATGQTNALGTDAIKVGFVYKPGRVTPVGVTGALNSVAFVNGGDGAPRNRPALAQAFKQNSNGARFIAVVNHLKSKGSACDTPDTNDGQGECNAVRVAAAAALRDWLATNPTGTGDPDVLILGDLNAYAKENPITLLGSAGYQNIVASFLGANAYSYVFDGQWGYLDHALASSSLATQVSGVTEWHINADEPSVLDYNTDFKSAAQIASLFSPDQFRMSDHDPVLVGLTLSAPPLVVTLTPPAAWRAGVSSTLGVLFAGPTARAPFTVRINWGDGTPLTQFVSTIIPRTPINRAKVYAAPGSYQISVTVTDRSGLTATETLNITVQP